MRTHPHHLVVLLVWMALWRPSFSLAEDSLIFAEGDSLWRLPGPSRASEAKKLAVWGRPATTITRIQASNDNEVLLFEASDQAFWVQLRDEGMASPRQLECLGTPWLSPDGRCVVCPGTDGETWIYRLVPFKKTVRRMGSEQVRFLGPRGDELLGINERGVVAISVAAPDKQRLLAPHRPDGPLLATPDGSRGVGVYRDDGDPTVRDVRSFRLDGIAAPRQLLRGGTPVIWSRDSQWILVQQEHRACVVRGVGGEYKCWPGFRSLAIAPDGRLVLLGRPSPGKQGTYDFYLAELAGPRPTSPQLLRRHVGPAALWVSRHAASLIIQERGPFPLLGKPAGNHGPWDGP